MSRLNDAWSTYLCAGREIEPLLAVVRTHVQRATADEDVAQNVTLAIWQHLMRGNPILSSFHTFVVVSTRNALAKAHKESKMLVMLPEDELESAVPRESSRPSYHRPIQATERQAKIVALLLRGNSVVVAAKQIGISKRTVYRELEAVAQQNAGR